MPPTGNRGDAAAAQGVEEGESREAGVADQNEVTPRQPPAGLQGELLSEVGQRLVPTALLFASPLGWHERGQKGQCPDASGLGDRGKQHQAHPAQAACLDEMRSGRAHRIAIDAARPDAPAPAPLDRVVEGAHPRAARR